MRLVVKFKSWSNKVTGRGEAMDRPSKRRLKQ